MRPFRKSGFLTIKRLRAALFALLLFGLCGCRGVSPKSEGTGTETPAYERVVMTFLVDERQTVKDELPAISEELNRLTREEIGVEVELLPLTERELASRFPLFLSEQEKIDLVFIGNEEIGRYFGRRMLRSLDEYLSDSAIDTEALRKSGRDLTEGAVYRGFTYGIGNVDDSGIYGRGFVMSKDALSEAGIVIDPEKVYTLSEAGEIFRRLKTRGGAWPVCTLLQRDGSVTENFVSPFYTSSSGERIGVDCNVKTGRFFNRYAAAYYRDFIYTMRSWYLEGLLYPDQLLSDYSPKELARAGIILGYASDNSPEHLSDSGFPGGAVIINMAKPYRRTGHPGSGYWTVPMTAENPEAAVRLLNLMYRDARITNLLSYGIEGVHYTVTDRDKGLIEGIKKEDGSGLYENPYRIYGNQEAAYRLMSPEVLSAYLDWKKSAEDVAEPSEDFDWAAKGCLEEIKAVQEAVACFAPLLESGSADPDLYYPRFLKALAEGGIDRLISVREEAAEQPD